MRAPVGLVAMAAAVVAAVPIVGACRPQGPPAPLEGTSWVLVPDVLGTPPPIVLLPVTARFDVEPVDHQSQPGTETVRGSTGCNDFSGLYTRQDDRLTIGPLTQTERACERAVMVREQEYLSRLRRTASYRIDARRTLHLRGADGRDLLRFTEVGAPTGPSTPQGWWNVTGYRGVSGFVPIGRSAPVAFELRAGGVLEGDACNRFSGRWTSTGTAVTITPEGSTGMACLPSEVMDQEAAIIRALGAARTWSVEQWQTLTLFDATGGTVLTAVAFDGPAAH